jgi:hypothetical protein
MQLHLPSSSLLESLKLHCACFIFVYQFIPKQIELQRKSHLPPNSPAERKVSVGVVHRLAQSNAPSSTRASGSEMVVILQSSGVEHSGTIERAAINATLKAPCCYEHVRTHSLEAWQSGTGRTEKLEQVTRD